MLLLAGAMTAPRPLNAQQKAMPVIGYLLAASTPARVLNRVESPLSARGSAKRGYVEGRNVTIEYTLGRRGPF